MTTFRKHVLLMVLMALAFAGTGAKAVIGQSGSDPLAEARSFVTTGRLAHAESWLHTYLNENPSSAEAHFFLGYVLFREQKARESLAEFTAGAAIQHPKANELRTVASDYVLLGDYTDADHWFTEVTVETPNDAETWYLLGRTKYNESRYEEGISSFERVLALRSKDVEAENNLGLCQRELNQLKEAKASFETAIEWQGQTPTDAQPFLNLGALDADASDLENAIRYLAQAAALSPDNPKIHVELGAVYQQRDDLPKAQVELERAVALAPNSSETHFKLAGLYRKEGKLDLAKQEFDICAKLNSTHSSSETKNPYKPGSDSPQ